jgi:triacylglycerol lipase
MAPLGRWLAQQGYRTHNWGYWSHRYTVEELAESLAEGLDRFATATPRVNFVTHSLGGILVRAALARRSLENAGRAVMLAPPNRGSRSADRWSPYLGRVLPPIRDLRTTEEALVHSLPSPRALEIGVIAGAFDGKVSVEESRLEGARDHVVIPCRHSFIMHREDVRQLTARFLRTGSFSLPP